MFSGSKMALIQQIFAIVYGLAGYTLRMCHGQVAGIRNDGFQIIGVGLKLKRHRIDRIETVGFDQRSVNPVARGSRHKSYNKFYRHHAHPRLVLDWYILIEGFGLG